VSREARRLDRVPPNVCRYQRRRHMNARLGHFEREACSRGEVTAANNRSRQRAPLSAETTRPNPMMAASGSHGIGGACPRAATCPVGRSSASRSASIAWPPMTAQTYSV
jgi:hypothetical protein